MILFWIVYKLIARGDNSMWIRTQNTRKLVKITAIQIKTCIVRRDSKAYCILGTIIGPSFRTKVELGRYRTLEEAQIILSDIQYHINIKSPKVYQMK